MKRNYRRAVLVVCAGVVGLTSCSTTRVEFADLPERVLMTSDQAKNPGNPFNPKDCPDCRFAIRQQKWQGPDGLPSGDAVG